MRRVVLLLAFLLALAGCRSNAAYYLAKGRELADKQQFAEAALNYRKAIQRDSQSGEAYYQLGLTEERLNERREAFQALSRAAELLPGRDDVKVSLGDFSFHTFLADPARPKMLYDKVTALADELIARDPKSYDGLRWKGYLATVDKKLGEAEDYFQRANAVRPMQPELILSWAHVLFLDNHELEGEQLARRLIEAHKTYEPIYDELFARYTLLKESSQAEAVLREKINNNPADSGAVLELAAFYAGASREQEMKAALQRMLDHPAGFVQVHLKVGDFYQGLRRWDEAVQQYEQGAEADPKEKILYLKKITNVRLAEGRGEQALRAVGEIRKQEPFDEGARAVQASLLLGSGNADKIKESVALFQALVNKHPENAVWRYNLGRALAGQGDVEGAKREFQEAAKRQHDFIAPRLALAQQSEAEGDYAGALRYANDILAIDPDLPTVRLIRAVSLINTGVDAQARNELMKLEPIFPDEVHLQAAVLDLKQRKFKEAEDGFRRLLQKEPTRAMTGLVQAEAGQKQIEKALPLLRTELEKSPNSQQLRLLMADAQVAAGRIEPAIEQYRGLLAMQPRSAQYHLSLGRALQLRRDLAGAIAEYRAAAALAPKDPLPPALLAHALIAQGDSKEAMTDLRLALSLRPGNAALMNDLAYLMANSGGNLDEAAALSQKAVQAAPGEPEMADTLAWIYFQQNRNDQALSILQDLVGKHPEKTSFRYHLGMAFLHSGDEASARREFNVALSMNPPADVRREIETALGPRR